MLIASSADPGAPRRVEIQPTAPGDPLLGRATSLSNGQLVLSSSAAFALHVSAGAVVDARVARLANGKLETVRLPLSVAAVAAPAVTTHDAAYVPLALAQAVEAYQEGNGAWPDLDRPVTLPYAYAGFRLYARRLDQVPTLDGALRGMGIEIVSRAGDVAGLLTLNRHLSILFALVASLGTAGFLVSLGTGLWANVERKRHGFALLRLAGLGAFALLLFPVAQSTLLALGGSFIGIVAAAVVAHIINVVFVGTLPDAQPLCTVTVPLAALATAATLLGAILAASFAGHRASRIQAWEGVTNA